MYRVKWSPFVPDVFLSCSADWTVKLWHQEYTSPLHSFQAGQVPVMERMCACVAHCLCRCRKRSTISAGRQWTPLCLAASAKGGLRYGG